MHGVGVASVLLALKGEGAVGVVLEVLSWEDEEEVPEQIREAREKYTLIRVHAPSLDHNLQPEVELLNTDCPFGKDGKCCACSDFAGLYTPDGSVFAHCSYEGYCSHEKNEEKETT